MNSEDIETLRNRELQGYEDDIKAEAMVAKDYFLSGGKIYNNFMNLSRSNKFKKKFEQWWDCWSPKERRSIAYDLSFEDGDVDNIKRNIFLNSTYKRSSELNIESMSIDGHNAEIKIEFKKDNNFKA